MRRDLDFDPASGIRHVFSYDEATDIATITVEQEVDALVEANKRDYNDNPPIYQGSNGEVFRKVASVPLSIAFKWWKEHQGKDGKAIAKFLNDGDNRAFRTRQGVV